MKSFFLICAAFAICICSGVWQSRGQATASATAIVQFNDGEVATVTDFSKFVGVQPNEMVTITVQFPASAAGQPVLVHLIDGGVSSVGASIPVAGADGSFTLSFVARNTPGRNSVAIRAGTASVLLQLWVIDSAHPQNNPSSMIAVSNG